MNKGITTASSQETSSTPTLLSLSSQSSFISVLSLGSGDTLLAAQRSGSVIKTAVSGGLGVIGIVNVESSWGRLRRVCLCVKHTDTSAALLDSDVSKRVRKGEKKQTSHLSYIKPCCVCSLYFTFALLLFLDGAHLFICSKDPWSAGNVFLHNSTVALCFFFFF